MRKKKTLTFVRWVMVNWILYARMVSRPLSAELERDMQGYSF